MWLRKVIADISKDYVIDKNEAKKLLEIILLEIKRRERVENERKILERK